MTLFAVNPPSISTALNVEPEETFTVSSSVCPTTSSFPVGFVVPIPKSPSDVIRALSSPFVPRIRVLEAGECIVVPVPRLSVSAESLSVWSI